MSLIQWDSNLSVNITEIDAQHQKLVAMINELNQAMREGSGREVIGKILQGLATYTATHFATEERFFQRHAFPASAAHVQEHRNFSQKVDEFKRGFEEGRLGLSVSVMNFLGSWLKDHIRGSDKEYAPFLNGKGVR